MKRLIAVPPSYSSAPYKRRVVLRHLEKVTLSILSVNLALGNVEQRAGGTVLAFSGSSMDWVMTFPRTLDPSEFR